MKIAINTKSCLRGTATQVEVLRTIYYPDGTATVDCQLLDAAGKAVDGFVAAVGKTETDKWAADGDAKFYAAAIAKDTTAALSTK